MCTHGYGRKQNANQQSFTHSENTEHVPAMIEPSHAEHDDPMIPRGIALHDLIHGVGNEHSKQLEGVDGRVGHPIAWSMVAYSYPVRVFSMCPCT